jgi:putative membrane protein
MERSEIRGRDDACPALEFSDRQAALPTPDFAALNPATIRVRNMSRRQPVNMMIKNFSDHSANERTFLAWVRTSIAVMAFGFIVEKFDLFLEVAAPQLVGRTLSLPGQRFANIAGLAFIVLGTAMVAIAAARFLVTQKKIDSAAVEPGAESRFDVALAVLLVLLGSAMFIYLSHALVTTE